MISAQPIEMSSQYKVAEDCPANQPDKQENQDTIAQPPFPVLVFCQPLGYESHNNKHGYARYSREKRPAHGSQKNRKPASRDRGSGMDNHGQPCLVYFVHRTDKTCLYILVWRCEALLNRS